MNKLQSIAIVLSIFMLSGTAALGAEPDREKAAQQEAEHWLSLVDGGEYEKSWGATAAFFKNAVPVKEWISSMNAYRKPLGRVEERTLKSAQYMTTLPGAPDGEYVVIQFSTAFEKKKTAVETITPMLNADGTWKVSGYFIK